MLRSRLLLNLRDETHESYQPHIQTFSPQRFLSIAPTNLHVTVSCKRYGEKTWIQGQTRNHKLVAEHTNTADANSYRLIIQLCYYYFIVSWLFLILYTSLYCWSSSLYLTLYHSTPWFYLTLLDSTTLYHPEHTLYGFEPELPIPDFIRQLWRKALEQELESEDNIHAHSVHTNSSSHLAFCLLSPVRSSFQDGGKGRGLGTPLESQE